jgi:Ca-activated chloride channel homolog
MDDGYRLLAMSRSFKIVGSRRSPRYGVRVVWPLLILVLVVVVGVVAVYLLGMGPEPTRRRDPGILRRRSKWRRWLPVIPLLGAVGCLALAFSGFTFSLRQTAPIAVLVLDASDSMNETDIEPDRLTAAKDAALAFLAELPDDFHVGLVTFAGDATLEVPPTEEREEVTAAIDAITTSSGTAIGDGVEEALDAVEAARAGGEAPAALLLLSDGRDTASVTTPLAAAAHARSAAVPVYTVVMGQAEGGADVDTLARVAETSGGDALTAESADELTRHFTTIGSELSVALEVQPSATPFVVAAIVLGVIAGFMLVLTPR